MVNIKIVYCTGALYQAGGAERVLISKANYFANCRGFEVFIITAGQLDNPYCFPVDRKVTCIDANIRNLFPSRIVPLVTARLVKPKIKALYQSILQKINPDIIIVNELGYEDELIPSLKLSAKTIREFHSSHFAVSRMIDLESGLKKLKKWYVNYKSFKTFSKFDAIVLLTKRDKESVYYKNNVTVIPNTLSNVENRVSSLNNKRAISVGRLDKLKNFKDQILIWRNVVDLYPDWTLDIYGDGPEKGSLEDLIKSLDLSENVFLRGRSDSIYEEYLKASFFLFTSLGEGFGMVLIEAMSCGLPCVSYDTPCGPSEIIDHEENGVIVKLGDKDKLMRHIVHLIESPSKLRVMGNKAKEKSKLFEQKNIMPMWEDFFSEILKK